MEIEPRTWNNIEMDIFNIFFRKLDKNANRFYLNMNFLKKSNRKRITLFNVTDVEIQLDVEIEPGCGN